MRIGVRIVLVSMAFTLAAAIAGCKGVTPPSIREEASTPSPVATGAEAPSSTESSPSAASKPAAEPKKPTSGQYAGTYTSAGVAVGAELQHTDQALLGGKLWAMRVDGQPDNATDKPKIQVVAVNAKDVRTAVFELPSGEQKGVSSFQGSFTAPLPAGTVKLLISTTLRSEGATGAAPVLEVPLAEVPVVKGLGAQ